MLSARELSTELPEQARTWVNQKLQFTHGNGLVMSFVSKTIGGSFPHYVLENISPESNYGLTMDLVDAASIDAFTERFLASGQPLHILVNSAGIMAGPQVRDARGYESPFATNHLGHFQLRLRQ